MTVPNRRWIHILVAALGLALMVGGTVAGKPGAGIIGLLIAAVNVQALRRPRTPGNV